MVKESTVVIIAIGEQGNNERPNVSHNLEIFRKVIPAISKFACRAVLLVATRPVDCMSYIAWKLSKFPSNRVLGTGTMCDTMKFQYHLGQRLGIANTSVNCLSIGAQGDASGIYYSSFFTRIFHHFDPLSSLKIIANLFFISSIKIK